MKQEYIIPVPTSEWMVKVKPITTLGKKLSTASSIISTYVKRNGGRQIAHVKGKAKVYKFPNKRMAQAFKGALSRNGMRTLRMKKYKVVSKSSKKSTKRKRSSSKKHKKVYRK